MRDFFQGVAYAKQGYKDIFHPKIRHVIFIPILINIVIFAALFYFGINAIQNWDFLSVNNLPTWLSWLHGVFAVIRVIILIIIYLVLLIVFAFLATIGANLLASPFNGLLSETFSKILGQPGLPQIMILKQMKVSVFRELKKFGYYLPKAIAVSLLCVILHFIPVLNLLIPFIFYSFSAWCMAIQYIDYPADNYHIAFPEFLYRIKKQKGLCLGFGVAVAFCSSIPLFNFLAMPAAVLGATRLWHEQNLG